MLAALLAAHAPLRAGDAPAPREDKAAELSLTLRRAVELALAKNFTIRAAAFQPAIAAERERAVRGRLFDPVVEAQARRSVNNNPQLADPVLGGLTRATQVTSDFFNADVRATTALGTTLSVGANAQNRRGDFNRGRDEWNTFAGVTAVQPFGRGFGFDAALAPIRVARVDRQTSLWAFRQTVIDIVTEAAQAYYDLYFAREAEAVAQRSRDLAARLLADNEQRVKIGTLTPLDISVARSQLAARAETIITARQAARESENALKLRVSDDVRRLLDVHLRIAAPDERLAEIDPTEGLRADLRRAYATRPDYQQALLDLQRRHVTLAFDKNAVAPQLDLTASLGANGLSRGLGESLAHTFQAQNLAYAGGVNFSLPLPNREARANLQADRLGIASALLSLKKLEQDIAVRLDNAAGAVRNGRARVTASTEALRLARESLAAEEQKLSNGTSTTFVVLQLQNDLATAENNRLRALTDYHKAIVAYDREAGRTLERNGVQLLP